MGWISIEERMPPDELQVLLEVSGWFSCGYGLVADHDFYLGSWIPGDENKEGEWLIYDSCDEDNHHFIHPKVHAWMPLPRHFEKNELFEQREDLMEHSMFDDEFEGLYEGKYVYEQMTLEEFLQMKG